MLALDDARSVSLAFLRGLCPDPIETVAEWADRYMVLPSWSAEPGAWRTSRTPYLREIMECLSPLHPARRVVFMKCAQIGGPLALDTPIPTVEGWTTMGAISAGDTVFNEQGAACEVLSVSDIFYDRPCYRLRLSDGSEFVCDDEHRWTVWDEKDYDLRSVKTLSVAEIRPTYLCRNGQRRRYAIDVAEPLDLPLAHLPIAPYALGVWLGDGSASGNSITTHCDDAEEMAAHLRVSGEAAVVWPKGSEKGNCRTIRIDSRLSGTCWRGHTLKTEGFYATRAYCHECNHLRYKGQLAPIPTKFFDTIRDLGIYQNKHVPAQYLRASIAQRFDLLQGLMDTDGSITRLKGHCEFSASSERLALNVRELLSSLGIKSTIASRTSSRGFRGRPMAHKTTLYRVSFLAYNGTPIFKLKRKLSRMIDPIRPTYTLRRTIDHIEPVASVPVRCIEVDSKSHLYLAGDTMVPTHNTSCGANWIGYTVHRAPTAMLIVEPTVDVAQKLSKQKIQPMFDSVPVLHGTVKDARSRDSGNTILAKEFTGGMIVLTGANSGVGLRFMSAQNLFLDEVDAYPYDVDGEGTPVAVAEKRCLTYARHKIYLCSTPVLKATSVIEPEYLASDQRRYQVPCPHCAHVQALTWASLKWPKDQPHLAQMECVSCSGMIAEHHKTQMLTDGRWVAAFPERTTAGFHLNALYAPYGWVNSWAYLAEEWTRIIHLRDLRQQQTFVNTNLAETWEETGEKLDESGLYARRERYPATCPEGVIVLTGAADVQDDRIEVECVGWGVDEESWSIDYRVFHGSPGQPDVWKELDRWRKEHWLHANGLPLTIIQLSIDTGGHHAKEAYEFVKARARERVCAVKGSNQSAAPLVGRPTTSNYGGVLLYPVGTDTAKDTIFSRLKLDSFGPGYCHFPETASYDDEYFAQLTSEEKRSKYEKGVLQGTYYKKIRARNEALDLKVYNLAAYMILNPNIAALSTTLGQRVHPAPVPAEASETRPPPAPFMARHSRGVRRGGFIGGWK